MSGLGPSSRGRMLRTVLPASLTVLVAVLADFPGDMWGLDRAEWTVQAAALRPHIVVATFVLGCVAAVLAVVWRLLWPIAVVLLIVPTVAAATIAPRTIPDREEATANGRTLTVLSFNTFEGRADVGALAALIERERPDLVGLPEAGDPFRGKLAALVAPQGYQLWSSTPAGVMDVEGVTALAGPGLRGIQARVHGQTTRPAVELTGGDLGRLRFVAFHADAPVNGRTSAWFADMERLPQWCAGSTPTIVAGDFNATLDHPAFRSAITGCADAAATLGDGLIPTWSPVHALRRLTIQIDHVLTTAGLRAETFDVFDLPGSDHRAIVAKLRIPATDHLGGPSVRASTQR